MAKLGLLAIQLWASAYWVLVEQTIARLKVTKLGMKESTNSSCACLGT